jgi:flagellar assembly factor FliW
MIMNEAKQIARNDSVILFEEGIIGVPRARRFQLLEKEGSLHRVLSCLDIKGFILPVIDPRMVDPEYEPRLGSRVTEAIELDAGDAILLLAVTSLEESGLRANLRAPLVINVKRRLAAQVILENGEYPLRAPVSTGA